jgi:citrate synthase
VVAALGSLKGPLHGGAPGPVLDMLDAIGSARRAPAWLRAELAAGRRIMGLGHRIYRVRDPRALVLETALAELERAGVESRYLPLARAVERAAVAVLDAHRPGRRLRTNVEFYTAVLLDALGVPRSLFTAVFAAGRVAGWLAHVAEERAVARLIRPRQRYVGPLPDGTEAGPSLRAAG